MLRLAHFYNDARKGLFPKVGAVAFSLANSVKIDIDNYKSTDLPLSHELSEVASLNVNHLEALTIRTCDSVNAQIDRLLESFGIED